MLTNMLQLACARRRWHPKNVPPMSQLQKNIDLETTSHASHPIPLNLEVKWTHLILLNLSKSSLQIWVFPCYSIYLIFHYLSILLLNNGEPQLSKDPNLSTEIRCIRSLRDMPKVLGRPGKIYEASHSLWATEKKKLLLSIESWLVNKDL